MIYFLKIYRPPHLVKCDSGAIAEISAEYNNIKTPLIRVDTCYRIIIVIIIIYFIFTFISWLCLCWLFVLPPYCVLNKLINNRSYFTLLKRIIFFTLGGESNIIFAIYLAIHFTARYNAYIMLLVFLFVINIYRCVGI